MPTSPKKKSTKATTPSVVVAPSNTVATGGNPSRQHNPVLIITVIVLLFAILIGFSIVIKRQRDTTASCIKDTQLIRAYNTAVANGVSASEYQNIITTIKEKSGNKNDIVCQYIVFQSALRSADQQSAVEAYALLKKMNNKGTTLPSGLVTGETVESLLEQFRYYEKDASRTEGVG